MHAVVIENFGDPTSVRWSEVPDPTVRAGHVVIDVGAASVNFPDLLLVAGTYQYLPDRPFSPGMEAVGVISAVGEGVTSSAVGDRVLALMGYGAFAEKCEVPAEDVVPIPDGVDDAQAAALGLAYSTAWFGLIRRAGMRASDTVLVTGAGGGVGSAGVDIAAAMGATVIALARDDERGELARTLGAQHVLTSTAETLRDDVLALTEGRGVDVVLESLGGDVLSQSIRCTAWEGRVVVTGFATGGQNPIKPGHLLVKNMTVMGLQSSDYRDREPRVVREALARLLELTAEGRLRPPVDRVYPIERAAEALEHLQRGGVLGKLVLRVR